MRNAGAINDIHEIIISQDRILGCICKYIVVVIAASSMFYISASFIFIAAAAAILNFVPMNTQSSEIMNVSTTTLYLYLRFIFPISPRLLLELGND